MYPASVVTVLPTMTQVFSLGIHPSFHILLLRSNVGKADIFVRIDFIGTNIAPCQPMGHDDGICSGFILPFTFFCLVPKSVNRMFLLELTFETTSPLARRWDMTTQPGGIYPSFHILLSCSECGVSFRVSVYATIESRDSIKDIPRSHGSELRGSSYEVPLAVDNGSRSSGSLDSNQHSIYLNRI